MIDHDLEDHTTTRSALSGNATVRYGRVHHLKNNVTWWFIPVSKWVITPVIVFLLVSQIHEASRRVMCWSDASKRQPFYFQFVLGDLYNYPLVN